METINNWKNLFLRMFLLPRISFADIVVVWHNPNELGFCSHLNNVYNPMHRTICVAFQPIECSRKAFHSAISLVSYCASDRRLPIRTNRMGVLWRFLQLALEVPEVGEGHLEVAVGPPGVVVVNHGVALVLVAV